MRTGGIGMLALVAATGMAGAEGERIGTEAGPVMLTEVVSDLDVPWALGFLPGGALLVTERDGVLLHIGADGARTEVAGVPEVATDGQGGLLDLLVPRDFAESREIFLTYSKPQGRGAGTALARARLSEDGTALTGVETLFELEPGSRGGRHFGSRVVEGPEGYLYLTVGDRGDAPTAQDLSVQNGSVLRLARDGSVPGDNPLAGRADAQPEIWSWGHRNPQGLAVDGEGRLWAVEHGAQGGDEVNLIRPGTNYGWPVISYGRHYSGARIGEGTDKPGLAQPAHYWDPSIAPSNAVVYDGALFPEWQGDLFVGSLKFGLVSRLEIAGDTVREVERIEGAATDRVRDIRQGPDGALWIVSEGNGAIYRMTPAAEADG